jgi:hypothetical protein
MGRETEGRCRRRWHAGQGLIALLLLGLPTVPACLEFRDPAAASPFLSFASGSVQEGEVTVADGSQAKVRYPHPFQSPPRLVIVEFRQAQFEERPYSKSDFQVVAEEADGFTIRNNHPEPGRGSCATVKWRAEGAVAREQPREIVAAPPSDKTAQELVIERVKKAGGSVSFDPAQPKGPVTGIDLHRTRVTDADLEQLFPVPPPPKEEVERAAFPPNGRDAAPSAGPPKPPHPPGLTGLRTLTLYNTRITDAGLEPVSRLSHLQALHLSDTAVTDAGLQQLRGLTELRDLGLNRTRVTDAGLAQLKGFTNLSSLALDGTRITDEGLAQLKGLRHLKHLSLNRTGVTPAGIQELKRALPNVQIFQ